MLQVNLRQAIHKTTSSVNTIPSPVISRPTTRLLPGIHPSLSLEEEESGPGDGVDAGIVRLMTRRMHLEEKTSRGSIILLCGG